MEQIRDRILISNVCDSIFLKKYYIKGQFEHPWYGSAQRATDYVHFIKTFNEIDFSKYKKLRYNETSIHSFKDFYSWNGHNKKLGISIENTVAIEYENGVQIMYPHLIYGDNFDIKYFRRYQRFQNINVNDILFILRVYPDYTKLQLDDVYSLKVNKLFIFPTTHHLKNCYDNNEYNQMISTDKKHFDFVKFIQNYDNQKVNI